MQFLISDKLSVNGLENSTAVVCKRSRNKTISNDNFACFPSIDFNSCQFIDQSKRSNTISSNSTGNQVIITTKNPLFGVCSNLLDFLNLFYSEIAYVQISSARANADAKETYLSKRKKIQICSQLVMYLKHPLLPMQLTSIASVGD